MITSANSPEAFLLACLLRESRQVREIDGLVSGSDFENPTLGVIFDGITQMAARGEATNAAMVAGRLAEWEVRPHQVDLPDLINLEHGAPVNAYEAPVYAQLIRTAAVKRGLTNIGRLILDDRGTEAYDLGNIAKKMLDEVLSGGGGGMKLISLGDLLATEDAEYDWLIPGLLERGDRLVLTGHEGQGKSWFMRQVAISAAAGMDPFTAEQIDPLQVVAIDAENNLKQWRRGTAYITGRAESWGTRSPREHVHLKAGERLDLTRPATMNDIHRVIDQYKPDILYIGPLYKLLMKEVTTDDDAAPLIAALDTVRERGVSLLIEAHAGHAKGIGGDRDMRPRGSSALLGWPEFGFGLKPNLDIPGRAELAKWRGDREERDWPRFIRRGVGGELPWMPVHEYEE